MPVPHSNIYATRPVILTVAAWAAIVLLLATAAAAGFAWYTHSPKLLYALGAIWAVGPPAWFWFEYFYLYRSPLGNPEAFEQFKYGQQVAVAIWAGVALALFAYLSSERFKPAPGEDERREAALPDTKPLLVTRHFTIFGTGPNIDFRELGTEVVAASVNAGAKQVRELIQGIGDGIEVAKKGVDLAAALVDLYRKIWPEKAATVSQPPPPAPVLPACKLFDQKVTFKFNSAELDPETRDRLSSVAQTLSSGRIAVLIEGHADGVGTVSFNERLSQRRADAVRHFLSDRGVLADQMHTYGYGKGYLWLPYAPQDDANRRVRIIECTVAGENRCQVSDAVRPGEAASN